VLPCECEGSVPQSRVLGDLEKGIIPLLRQHDENLFGLNQLLDT
jgi:hypothetical protein